MHQLAMTFGKKCFRFANNGAFPDITVPFRKGREVHNKYDVSISKFLNGVSAWQ